jgi:hypothetical protein
MAFRDLQVLRVFLVILGPKVSKVIPVSKDYKGPQVQTVFKDLKATKAWPVLMAFRGYKGILGPKVSKVIQESMDYKEFLVIQVFRVSLVPKELLGIKVLQATRVQLVIKDLLVPTAFRVYRVSQEPMVFREYKGILGYEV